MTGDQDALNQGNLKAEEGEWKRDLADGKVPVPSAERVKGKVERCVPACSRIRFKARTKGFAGSG